MARAELIKESKSNIRDARTAKDWLREREHTVPDETITIGALAMALLRDAGDTNTEHGTLIDTARAVALCLEQFQKENVVRDLTTKAKEEITEAKVEAMEILQKMAEKVEEGMRKAQEKMEESIAKNVSEANTQAQTRRESSRNTTDGRATSPGNPGGTQQPSYAQALASQAPRTPETEGIQIPYFANSAGGVKALDDIKAREARRAKQILVDGIDGVTSATDGLNCKELVEKANIAWEALPKSRARDEFDDPEDEGDGENISRPENVRFIAAMKLRNGGVVFDCNSAYGIDWLRHSSIKQEFERNFGGSAVVKNRAFTLIIGYLPVRLKDQLGSAHMCTAIERDNDDDIRLGSIKKLRWMRNPEVSWNRSQQFAHALVTIDDKQTANNIIRNGIIVEGERRWVKKTEDEPKRCYRCQLIDPGHRAATCTRPEVCANCRSTEHQTGKCKAKPTERRCASCTLGKRKNNHASWDRYCPVYIERKSALRDRAPENHFRFYPDEHEAWTWEQRYELRTRDGESDTRVEYIVDHPARSVPTMADVIPKPDRRSKQRRRREDHVDDEEIERGTQALMDMYDKMSDEGEEKGDKHSRSSEDEEEDDHEEDDDHEEGQLIGGKYASVRDMIAALAPLPPPDPWVEEAFNRSESRASTRGTTQSTLPTTWTQPTANNTKSSSSKRAGPSSRK